jgi:hypothetical protein
MTWLVVEHKVEDYAKWKPSFDASKPQRDAAGLRGGYIMHSPGDPNDLTVALQIDDIAKAREFMQSDFLREAIKQAGVIGEPVVKILEVADEVAC